VEGAIFPQKRGRFERVKALEGEDMVTFPKEMIRDYIERRVADLAMLERGSIHEFQRIGHQLSGSARNFGFPDLEAIALRMEKICAQEIASEGPRLIAEFRRWIQAHEAELVQD
jgi:HPt (histidine-containing phosphotransfer) domain-containing protein